MLQARCKIVSGSLLKLLFLSLLAVSAFGASASETVLYNFSSGAYGSNPYASLILDSSGNLYGTTGEGGNSTQCNLGSGCGTVFMLTAPSSGSTTWTQSVLYSFQGASGNDGSSPQASLVFDSKGNLYGTTASGGKYNYGTVFKLTPPVATGGAWTETVLYSFKGGTDGSNPASALVFTSTDTTLYGTTPLGGASSFGTVFKLSVNAKGTAWAEAILYSFTGLSDGGKPYAGLALKSGSLYGTTLDGGVSSQGAVFKLSPPTTSGGAWTETVLYSFTGQSDGGKPYAGVIFNTAGSLFSTTGSGGSGYGTVFEMTPPKKGSTTWTEKVLYAFTGGTDGSYARSGLVFDASGNLYSTTGVGSANSGVVFELSPPAKSGGAWTESVLWTFSGGSDGGDSTAGVAISGTNIYGTTSLGGQYGQGTVFEVAP
jgi:uncharacterized repeat protein (TIGR03803 family)